MKLSDMQLTELSGETRGFLARLSAVKPETLPVADSVKDLERWAHVLEQLVGEMLATVLLEGNAHLFKDFPSGWHDLVEDWCRRYRATQFGDNEEVNIILQALCDSENQPHQWVDDPTLLRCVLLRAKLLPYPCEL